MEEPLSSGRQWQELPQAGTEGRAHEEGLAQRGPETSQPVMGLRFGNKIEAWGHRRR